MYHREVNCITAVSQDSELTGNKRVEIGVRPARQIRDFCNKRFSHASNDASNNGDRSQCRMLAEGGGCEREVDVNRVGGERGDVGDESAVMGVSFAD